MAGSSNPGRQGSSLSEENLAGEELFLDQLKDSFVFFTALTTAAMAALAEARKQYQQTPAAERNTPKGRKAQG